MSMQPRWPYQAIAGEQFFRSFHVIRDLNCNIIERRSFQLPLHLLSPPFFFLIRRYSSKMAA